MGHKNQFVHDQQEDSTSTPENGADDSAYSGDEAYEVSAPSPKKRFNLLTCFWSFCFAGFFFVFAWKVGGLIRKFGKFKS